MLGSLKEETKGQSPFKSLYKNACNIFTWWKHSGVHMFVSASGIRSNNEWLEQKPNIWRLGTLYSWKYTYIFIYTLWKYISTASETHTYVASK